MEFIIIENGTCDKCENKAKVLIGLREELEVREHYICKDCVIEMLVELILSQNRKKI